MTRSNRHALWKPRAHLPRTTARDSPEPSTRLCRRRNELQRPRPKKPADAGLFVDHGGGRIAACTPTPQGLHLSYKCCFSKQAAVSWSVPKTRAKSKKEVEGVRLTPGQKADLDYLVAGERYGTSRSEVIRYFVMRGLEEFDKRGQLPKRPIPTEE